MIDQQLRAKELFDKHYGNKLQMFREGQLEEYKSCNIAIEQEMQWIKELIQHFSAQLSIRNWDAVHHLDVTASNYKDIDIVTNILLFSTRHLKSADSIVKLKYAEYMIHIIGSTKDILTKAQLIDAIKKTLLIFDDIIKGQLVVDPGHELSLHQLSDKKSLNNRAKRGIEQLEGITI
ncbi:hypothetical protein [Paenibacillus endoradicis]|uniref:hypothetical protein n=1 Tax=Paenibacillus endoradicis TaxID=2972487 RepID=UPI002159915D|nr:hypothetical protein [Paenibacillus endoradicis]MCR8656212.1 hypothetical protein [Paenibacillus endoradicis]